MFVGHCDRPFGLLGLQETMTGSTSLVAAMAGDVKKAAQMLDTLAPEVLHLLLITVMDHCPRK